PCQFSFLIAILAIRIVERRFKMEDLFHIEHSKLTDSEQQIVDFFNKNQQVVPFLSISEISHAIGISNSTLTRFSKKIGFKNFKELKLSFISKGEVTPSTKLQS